MEFYTQLPFKLPKDRQVKITRDKNLYFRRSVYVFAYTLYLPESSLLYYAENLVLPYIHAYMGFCLQENMHKYERVKEVAAMKTIKGTFVSAKTGKLVKSKKVIETQYKRTWNVPYIVIQDFFQLCDEFPNVFGQEIICDIETDNLYLSSTSNNLLCIGLYYDNKAIIIPADLVLHDEDVHCFLQTLFSNNRFIFHNGKFDTSRLKSLANLYVSVYFDTQLYHYTHVSETRGLQNLKGMAMRFLDAPAWEDELHEIKKTWARQHKVKIKDFSYGELDVSVLYPYLAMDLFATKLLYDMFIKYQDNKPYKECYKMLLKGIEVFSSIEANGMLVDTNYLEWLREDITRRILKARTKVYERLYILFGSDLGLKSLQSYKKLQDVFVSILKVYQKDFAWLHSANKETREKLQEILPEEPIFEHIDEYYKMKKYLSTYVDGIKKHIQPSGLIHCTYNLTGTETGRLSCNFPNLQNIPRDKYIKSLFIVPEGRYFVNIDASAVELRVLALLTQDPWLLDIYKQKKDLHLEMAIATFGEQILDLPKEELKYYRFLAKSVNFGAVYGITAEGLARNTKIPIAQAKHIIDMFYKTKPVAQKVLKQWVDNTFNNKPFVTFTGRTRDAIITRDNREHIARTATNFPVQSTANDITLLVLLGMYDNIQEENRDIKILGTVHDSIMYDAPSIEDIDWLHKKSSELYRNIPYSHFGDSVEFLCDCEKGSSWGNVEEHIKEQKE